MFFLSIVRVSQLEIDRRIPKIAIIAGSPPVLHAIEMPRMSDKGMFSEYNMCLLFGWLAHNPGKVLSQNLNIPEAELSVLPEQGLYIFPGTVPGPLENHHKAVGRAAVCFQNRFHVPNESDDANRGHTRWNHTHRGL